jgi:hypothetical protein
MIAELGDESLKQLLLFNRMARRALDLRLMPERISAERRGARDDILEDRTRLCVRFAPLQQAREQIIIIVAGKGLAGNAHHPAQHLLDRRIVAAIHRGS